MESTLSQQAEQASSVRTLWKGFAGKMMSLSSTTFPRETFQISAILRKYYETRKIVDKITREN